MFHFFSHIRPLGAAGALAVDICICFHDIESYIFAKSIPSLAVQNVYKKYDNLQKIKKLKKTMTNVRCINGFS